MSYNNKLKYNINLLVSNTYLYSVHYQKTLQMLAYLNLRKVKNKEKILIMKKKRYKW